MNSNSAKFVRRMIHLTVVSLCFGLLNPAYSQFEPWVIYGEDNRQDIYQVESSELRDLAKSTAAMVQIEKLTYEKDSTISISSTEFGVNDSLCSDEPFFHQPVAADCSGFFVGEDLLVTAGHCITSTKECANNAWVFGFAMASSTRPITRVSEDQVFHCKEILKTQESDADFALIRLNRRPENIKPLNFRREGQLYPGDPLFVIGHPSGLPSKLADGATVRNWSKDRSYFLANLDTYAGNSGSAVFNATTLEVEGILVRGATDFTYDPKASCYRSAHCLDNECEGEEITNISYIGREIERQLIMNNLTSRKFNEID